MFTVDCVVSGVVLVDLFVVVVVVVELVSCDSAIEKRNRTSREINILNWFICLEAGNVLSETEIKIIFKGCYETSHFSVVGRNIKDNY